MYIRLETYRTTENYKTIGQFRAEEQRFGDTPWLHQQGTMSFVEARFRIELIAQKEFVNFLKLSSAVKNINLFLKHHAAY